MGVVGGAFMGVVGSLVSVGDTYVVSETRGNRSGVHHLAGVTPSGQQTESAEARIGRSAPSWSGYAPSATSWAEDGRSPEHRARARRRG